MHTQEKLWEILESFIDRTAIEEGGAKLSYGDLLRQARAVSLELTEQGTAPLAAVGVCAHAIAELVPAMIGVMMARCVFVPLNPGLPAARFGKIVQQSGLGVILAGRDAMAGKEDEGVKIVGLNRILQEASGTETPLRQEYGEDDPLYIYFTSGSTGEPKGIVGRNRSLWHFLQWERGAFKIGEGHRFSQLISPYFDAFLRDVFIPLITGGTICVPPGSGGLPDSARLSGWIGEQRISFIHCVPSLFRVFIDDTLSGERFRSLQYILMSGERIRPSDLAAWYRVIGNRVQLVNLYGVTEATMISSYHRIRREDADKDKVSIGRPIADTELVVLDGDYNRCKAPDVGELYIVTDFLSLGYLNNPALTSQKFVKLEEEGGKTAYRTGDKARITMGGSIDLLGREDRLIKLRGIRIELDEIESVMVRQPLVRMAVVLYDQDADALFGFVTPVEGNVDRTILAGQVESYLKDHLPYYMIPSGIVALDSIPLLSNGKTDYKKLKEEMAAREVLLPANETEEKISAIWKELLNIDRVSTDVKFNSAGGDSLSMMRLIPTLFSAFGVRFSFVELISHLTIKDQAAFIHQRMRESLRESADDLPAGIRKAPARAHYALSYAQRRLFFLSELDNSSVAYNMPYVVEVLGNVEAAMFEKAFEKLILRHESLRTAIVMVDGRGVQKVYHDVSFAVEYFEADAAGAGSILQDFVRPFDISRPPLFRAGLIKTGAARYLLMVDVHHIVADGQSLQILIRDFMALYNREVLPELTLQYTDFAEWQQGELYRGRVAGQREFWLRQFEREVSVLNLPFDFPRPELKSYRGGSLSFVLDAEATDKLRVTGEKAGATMFMTVLALFNILMSKLSDNEDIVVGTGVAGRHHPGLDEISGMFVNTLPLRNFPQGGLTFSEFLQRVSESTSACFDNQEYPYEELIGALKVQRDTSRNPLFDVMLLFHNYEQKILNIPGLQIRPFDVSTGIAKFDLTLAAMEHAGELHLSLEYATDLFTEKTIERFIDYFRRIVAAVLADPSGKLSQIAILSGEEREMLIHGFNRTAMDYPRHKTVTDGFREQARRTPDRAALICGDVTLSYGELDAASDVLAAYLIRKGVRPGVVVGLLCDRSVELITGMLGILKAGAAYLPLDPTHPGNRIDSIVEDSHIGTVLTRSGYREMISKDIDILAIPPMDEWRGAEAERAAAAGDLAYVIYTSGSTGKPKGVMIPHTAVTNFSHAMERIVPFRDRIVLSVTNHSFDIFVLETLVPLQFGGTVVMATDEQHRDPAAIGDIVSRYGVNMMQTTPSLMRMILEENSALAGFQTVTHMLLGGEALPLAVLKRLQRCVKARIFNLYGPTETTVWSAVQELTGARRITIGKPIGNTRIYILDRDQRLQPVGVPGELCISGDGVARGYWNNAELTAEKFIANPIVPGGLLYKTGDICRWLADGTLEYTGRRDDQVKIRGARIDPGDIESHLATYPGVKGAVAAIKERGEDKYLAGYYVAEKDIPAAALVNHLTMHLPAYMVPAQYVRLERLPLTHNGKINRSALPEPDPSAGYVYVGPSGETEEALVKIWGDLLKVDRKNISVTRSFFDLGGDSINIVVLRSRVNAHFNTHFSLVEMFNMPTVSSMAGRIDRSGPDNGQLMVSALGEEAELRDGTLALIGQS